MKSPGPRRIKWVLKPIIHVLALLPFALLVVGFFRNTLGVNPVETLTHSTGEWALRILLVTLAITPLARIFRAGWLIQLRRLVGLYSFFYGLTHFLIYLLFDLSFDFGFLVEDILDRPYITVGFAAFVILLILAGTSTIRIRQKMGKTWDRLHRLVYGAGILAIIHFLWVTRVDDTEPMIYGGILVILLGYRLFRSRPKKSRKPNQGVVGNSQSDPV